MLIIFAFFSVISMVLVACFSVALLNVVVRRENAYLIEERLNAILDSSKGFATSLIEPGRSCETAGSSSPRFSEYSRSMWPGTQISMTMFSDRVPRVRPKWLRTDSFAGIVIDRDSLAIRSFHVLQREGCVVTIFLSIPLKEALLQRLSRDAGLQLSSSKSVMLHPYRIQEGIGGEIKANFIPGSPRPVPVVAIARNWQTGELEDWIVCQVRPSYSRTIDDLSHMGLRTASWVSPFGGMALALVFVYGCGLVLSVRLSQRIVTVIDGLSHAAFRVGKGDFSVRIAVPKEDQLGMLASSFNEMTRDLENLREQEKRNAILERDIALAHEVQQYLYPPVAAVWSAASVCGVTTPARILSGDLYDFLSFSNGDIGLVCADISGKGVSAALMMARLQALVHGRQLALDENNTRPGPGAFVTALNRDFRGRFGNNRYATMFYGEFDSCTNTLKYVNAGHCPPILISGAGEATTLSEGDLPIGLFSDVKYEERRVTLSRGCALVVYTDGVTDATNLQGEEFGEERLMNVCTSLPKGADAKTICELLSREVAEWATGVEKFDDMTVLGLSVH
jgi:serine phosphatase RsbU (regulator of sigma subunit)